MDHVGEVVKPVTGLRSAFPTSEFTRGDKFIYYGNLVWTLGWFAVFLILTLYSLFNDMSDDAWLKYWSIWMVITLIVGTVTTVWFFIGGIYDIRKLFDLLDNLKRDDRDDGRVEGRHIVADMPAGDIAPAQDTEE